MKHNIKSVQEKNFLALKTAYYKKLDAISNLGWITLETPYQDGWYAKLKLRRDISNREDAWVFEYILDNFSTQIWARTPKDFWWNRKWKSCFRYNSKPRVSAISEATYQNLPPQVRHWFSAESVDRLYSKGHYCTVPDFFFEICYVKRMIEKVRVFDADLQSEKEFLIDKLYADYFNKWVGYSSAPKHYRKTLNKKQRHKAKAEVFKIVRNWDPTEDNEFDFRENFKGAAWLYW